MPWARLDDQWYDNPKTVAVGTLGAGLFAMALSYASCKLTDGFIPVGMILRLCPDVDEPLALADRLVAAGYFEKCDGGYMIHDYLDYNPSAERVNAIRQARAEAGRCGGITKAANQTSSNLTGKRLSDEQQISSKTPANSLAKTVANGQQNSTPFPSPSPIPKPIPIPKKEMGADAPPVPLPKLKHKPTTEAGQEYFAQFNRKRWATNAQRDEFEKTEHEVGTSVMLQAVNWAAVQGIPSVKSICTTARKMAKGPQARASPNEPRGFAGIRDYMEKEGINGHET